MNDTIHFLYTPFTGLGKFYGYRGDRWYTHRMLIFLKYTMNSLLNQTNQDFIHWCSFRPEERNHKITNTLMNWMRAHKRNFIFTYGGPMFWDDKYPEEEEKNRFLERLKINLPDVEHLVSDYKYVYKTIMPSDDMYHKDVVQSIQDEPYRERGALIHNKGYVLNDATKYIAEWVPPEGKHYPPFYTLMYPKDVFIDPKKHFDYVELYRSHEDVPELFDAKFLPDYRYMVLTHENNISTTWYCRYKGKMMVGEEREKILKDFGLYDSSYSDN